MKPEQDFDRRLTRALIFYKKDLARIEDALRRYQAESHSQCNLLVDQDGALVSQVGTLKGMDQVAVAALVAGAFAATRKIARSLGEADFATLTHEGADESLQMTQVGEHTILATIYSPRLTTSGLVAFYLGSVAHKLRAILDSVAPRLPARSRKPWEPDLGADPKLVFAQLFGDERAADSNEVLFPELR